MDKYYNLEKPIEPKAQYREEIKSMVEKYLANGGEIEEVPYGVSGESKEKILKRVTFNKDGRL